MYCEMDEEEYFNTLVGEIENLDFRVDFYTPNAQGLIMTTSLLQAPILLPFQTNEGRVELQDSNDLPLGLLYIADQFQSYQTFVVDKIKGFPVPHQANPYYPHRTEFGGVEYRLFHVITKTPSRRDRPGSMLCYVPLQERWRLFDLWSEQYSKDDVHWRDDGVQIQDFAIAPSPPRYCTH